MEATNLDLLENALTNLGFEVHRRGDAVTFTKGDYYNQVSGRFANGELKVDTTGRQQGRFDVNELKREYSREVVKSSAQRFGWALKEKSPNNFVAGRRCRARRTTLPVAEFSGVERG